jgi:xylitol oxidase
VKALGSRHSFSGVADTEGTLLSLKRMNRVVALDAERRSVTVEGGITYGQLCPLLHREGWALHNLASLPHITVAGACATATHGSGDGNRCLAAAVSALEVVTADGSLRRFAREDGDLFLGAVVSLGGLGVVTQLTLDIQPTFALSQVVYERLSLAQLEARFDAVMGSAYSVSLFTDWREPVFNQVWLKRRLAVGEAWEPPSTFFGAPRATQPLHPIAELTAENTTEQLGLPGPWHERLPHFRIDHMPSAGDELQSEYFVPRQHACAALRALSALSAEIAALVQISEIRTVAADEFWMSPHSGRESVGIHFTWHPNWPGVSALLPRMEELLAPFEARPHWAKLFTMPPARLQALYPRLPEFRSLLKAHDPTGKFRNEYLERNILGS